MNKKLLAVALATAFAAPAMADGVQIYGAFDVGVLVRGGSDNALNAGARGSGTETQVASGMNGHNGIGFRMSEDLGNGMKISGDAMFGFALDAGNFGGSGGGFNTIYSYLALSGDFGTLIAGRAGGARAGFIKKYDPFGGFGVGSAFQVHTAGQDYADNVVAWITPEVLPGLKGLAAYTSNLNGQDQQQHGAGSTPLYAVAALYNSGPVDVTVAYEKVWIYTGATTPHVMTVGASYDFGVIKAMGLWSRVTTLGLNGYQLGFTAPIGEATKLKMVYAAGENDPGNAECKKVGVGIDHDLSKRTRLYADGGYLLDIDQGAAACQGGINTYVGTHASGGASRDNNVGYGEWGMNVGVRHSF